MHLRIYQLFRNVTNTLLESLSGNENQLNSKGSLMKRIVANKNIEYQSTTYNIGINQFRSNLTEILKLAQANHVDVFLSDLVSNVKDLPPFGSAPTGAYPAADSVYKQAWKYYNAGDYAKADSVFYLAKDLDLVRFRASEQINSIIDSLSKAFNCYKVPTKELFKSASPHGIIGHNLITEHLHPNISGQFLLADAFFTSIVNSKAIASKPVNDTIVPASFYRTNWPYTELDSLLGLYKVNQLKSYWPFTSVDEKLTFREKHKISGILDSLAFQVVATNLPYVPKLHDILASDYIKKGEYEKALREYKAMNKISPYWSIYYNKTAICYLKLDDLYNAEKSINDALKYSPNYLSYFTLAEIESIKHNFKQATEYYNSALENTNVKEERIETLKKICFTYSILGETDKKDRYESKLKKLGIIYKPENAKVTFTYSNYIPKNIKNQLSKSSQYIEKQQLDSARYWINKAILINDCPVANFYMGELLKLKRDKDLLFYYQKAYPAYCFDPKYLHSLFIAYVANSDFEKAKQTLNEIKFIEPGYSAISKLEKLIERK
jgi:tetratricopeptide (TPR) repeat protein